MNGFLATNTRDKFIILGLIVVGFGCLGGCYFGKMELKEGLMIVITALATAFKGLPSPPAQTTTTETTTSSTPSSTVSPAPPSPQESPAPPPVTQPHPLGGAPQTITPISDMLKG